MDLATNQTQTLLKPDALKGEIDRLQAMIASPQMRDMRKRTSQSGQGYIRPRNAATIILVDGSRGNYKILMGQRNKALKFMPGALVFPGGAVDRADGDIATCDSADEKTTQRIVENLRGRSSKRAAKALTVAAIRELAEETGLLVGKPSQSPPLHDDWGFFKNRSLAPSISSLRLLSRAITPPGAPRRFDTWFFIAPANAVQFTPDDGFDPSGELENLCWVTPQEAIAQNTQEITRVMLVELMNRLAGDDYTNPNLPAPSYFFAHKKFQRNLMK